MSTPTLREAAQAVIDATADETLSRTELDALEAALAAPAADVGVEPVAWPMRTCNNENCSWVGPESEAVHPKHDPTMLLCPVCRETTEAEDTDVFDWLETEVQAIGTWYRGDPSYEHSAGWMKDEVLRLLKEARKALPSTQLHQAVARAREEAAQRVEALIADHVAHTQKSQNPEDHCSADDQRCEYVVAWRDAVAAIRQQGETP